MQKFLQKSLKTQINLFLIILFVVTIGLVFSFSTSIFLMQFQYMKEKNNEYFLSMERGIMQSDIYFINICLLQYENIVKFFNTEMYHYNHNITLLFDFYERTKIPDSITKNFIHIFNNISELLDYPDYNESSTEDEKKIFIYCALNNPVVCGNIAGLIQANSLAKLNQYKGIRNFVIPFYGNMHLIEESIIFFKNYQTFYTINNTKLKELFNQYGNIENIINQINLDIEKDYIFHEKYINEFSSNKVKLLELMYNKTYYIFEVYKSLNDTFEKDNYIKNHSIYFQSIDYKTDVITFFDTWKQNEANLIGGNKIIPHYIASMLFNISKKLDILTLPMDYSDKKLISKNLCYYFITKQLYLVLTKTGYSYDLNELRNIYEKINSSDITDVNDCKLDKYYEDISETFNKRDEFFNYYDLENTYDTYFYKLIKGDSDSYIYEMKSTYPNFECLKLFYPNFFSFNQIDFYSYTFGANLSRIMSSSEGYIDNIKYFLIIVLWFFWLIIILVFILLLLIIVPKITNPIVRLTQIINLNSNDLKNENIFEYKLDDDINKFFSLCKNLIDGEMINNDLKLNEILEDKNLDDSSNNNMIINNKMILELIENQKSLNDNDKDIFLLKESNINDKGEKYFKPRRVRSKNTTGINHLDVIKLISLNDGEKSEKNSVSTEKDKMDNEEIYSHTEEEDSETNDLKLYEDLIKIADFVFYGKEKEKTKMRKNIDKLSSVSKKSKQESDFKMIKGFNNIAFYWYRAEKANKTIRSYSHIYS